MKTVDGPFCIIYQIAADLQQQLKSAFQKDAHLLFTKSWDTLHNFTAEVFPDVTKLVIIYVDQKISDYDAIKFARELSKLKHISVIIAKDKIIRRWAEPRVHFVTTDKVEEVGRQLLAA